MNKRMVNREVLNGFEQHLHENSYSKKTIEKYLHDVWTLIEWLNGRQVTKDLAVCWREELIEGKLSSSTINGRVAAANVWFRYLGQEDYVLESVRRQRRFFRDEDLELTREEYERLVMAAMIRNDSRMALLFETICSTGIRVSEVQYITVEAAKKGRAEVSMKGTYREILIPKKLRPKLQEYAGEKGIESGAIFLSKSGNPLSRQRIWEIMKTICADAQVDPQKVYPHNLGGGEPYNQIHENR